MCTLCLSCRIVSAFESITESMIEQSNFEDIDVSSSDVALSGQSVSSILVLYMYMNHDLHVYVLLDNENRVQW